MKRCASFLLMLVVCLLGEGCRRNQSEPGTHRITAKAEKDLMMSKTEKSFVFSLRPADRRIKIYLENLKEVQAKFKAQNDPEAEKKYLSDLAARQKEMEDKKDDKVDPLKVAMQAQEEKEEFQEFTLSAIAFYAKTKPVAYTTDNFYSFVRRAEPKLFVSRRYLDKVEREIVIDEYPIYKFIDDDKIKLAIFVDKDNPTHLVAYASEGDTAGPFAGRNDKNLPVSKIPKEQLKLELDGQELQTLRLNYLAYLCPLYVVNAEAELKGFQDNPPGRLALLDQRGGVRKPPEARDKDKFMKYLRDNAPPALVKDVEDQAIMVNINANPRNPADPIASRSEFEIILGADKQKVPLGHRTIYMGSGTPGYASPQVLPYQFPPPKAP